MARSKTGVVIGILFLVIVVLLAVIAYAFLVRPALTGYVTERQVEGFEFAIVSIMQQAASCQPVPLTYENDTINIIAIECLQQPQQPAEAPPQE